MDKRCCTSNRDLVHVCLGRALDSQPSICPRQKAAATSSSWFVESLETLLSEATAPTEALSETPDSTLVSASAVGTDFLLKLPCPTWSPASKLVAWTGASSPARGDGSVMCA